jgi:hypothetical protein
MGWPGDPALDGAPLPTTGQPPSSYRVLVSRSGDRPQADLYPFALADPIPAVPIPLQPEDPEPVVSLQAVLLAVYSRSGYDHFIDYRYDPPPPLTPTETAWIDHLLRQQGWR